MLRVDNKLISLSFYYVYVGLQDIVIFLMNWLKDIEIKSLNRKKCVKIQEKLEHCCDKHKDGSRPAAAVILF